MWAVGDITVALTFSTPVHKASHDVTDLFYMFQEPLFEVNRSFSTENFYVFYAQISMKSLVRYWVIGYCAGAQ